MYQKKSRSKELISKGKYCQKTEASGHKTRKDKQLKFYKTMVLPCLVHGSETWTLRTDAR
jgi:hypothetical protein